MAEAEYRLSKIEAAERQVEAAAFLILYTNYQEAIHTLIVAATGVIEDLARKTNNPQITELLLRENETIRPDMRKAYADLKKRAANFLKHADRDPEGILDSVDLEGFNEIGFIRVASYLQMMQRDLSLGARGVRFYCSTKHKYLFVADIFESHRDIFPALCEDFDRMTAHEVKALVRASAKKFGLFPQ